MSQITDTVVNFADMQGGANCLGNGWGWKSSAAGTDGDRKLALRGQMGMDTVCAEMDGGWVNFPLPCSSLLWDPAEAEVTLDKSAGCWKQKKKQK